jgi:hypothetical protein
MKKNMKGGLPKVGAPHKIAPQKIRFPVLLHFLYQSPQKLMEKDNTIRR